jgi:hypothetical protein
VNVSRRVPQVGCRRTERRLYDKLQASSDTQAIGSHRSDGDGPSGPIGQMEMENGPIGTRDTQVIKSHMSDGDGEWSHRYT